MTVRDGFKSCSAVAVCLLLGALGTAAAQSQLQAPEDRSVHDFAGVLSARAVQTMERFDKELLDRTRVAIVVVTIPSLDGEPIRDFSVRLGTEWGVGKQDVDRGIVVALAVEERGIDIATGYGVEGFCRTAGSENRIAVKCRRYNAAVEVYRTDIRRFPNNVLVGTRSALAIASTSKPKKAPRRYRS